MKIYGLSLSSAANWTLGLSALIVGIPWWIVNGYWSAFIVLIPVYPISIIMCGLLLMVMEINFKGILAIPMSVMVIFLYECLIAGPQNYISLLSLPNWALYGQMTLAFSGWIFAGRPGLVLNKMSWLPFISFLLFSTTHYYHLVEATFYLYAVTGGVRPRNVGTTEPMIVRLIKTATKKVWVVSTGKTDQRCVA